jgi:hypothetical protein
MDALSNPPGTSSGAGIEHASMPVLAKARNAPGRLFVIGGRRR